jgi:NifU-like protein involved in Fe-S cluster formation
MPYSAVFNDHVAHPRHPGEITNADAVAEEVNPVCGDRIRLSLSLANDQIVEARFLAYGCAATLACGSVLAEMVLGRSVAQAGAISRAEIINRLDGLPRRKHHAEDLAIETLLAALAQLN